MAFETSCNNSLRRTLARPRTDTEIRTQRHLIELTKTEQDSTETPTIAVTGAAGFIGSRVVNRLQATNPEWDIVALDNFYLGQVRKIGDIEIQHVDIRNRDRLETTLDGADIVLHLAAISGVDDCD